MTLLQLIKMLEAVAANQPAVNMVVRENIYKLNSCPSCRYGVFGWTQGQHRASVDSDFTTFAFTLFYVDRLNLDKSNGTEIHSVGVEVLGNILRTLAEEVGVSEWRITPFTGQKFTDECNGVYATVELTVPASAVCGQTYDYYVNGKGAYNIAFSEAFQVWIWQLIDKEVYLI